MLVFFMLLYAWLACFAQLSDSAWNRCQVLGQLSDDLIKFCIWLKNCQFDLAWRPLFSYSTTSGSKSSTGRCSTHIFNYSSVHVGSSAVKICSTKMLSSDITFMEKFQQILILTSRVLQLSSTMVNMVLYTSDSQNAMFAQLVLPR